MKLAVTCILVLSVVCGQNALAAQPAPPPELIAELCTSEWNDVLPRQIFRVTVTLSKGQYILDFVRFYDNHEGPADVYWERGFLSKRKIEHLSNEIKRLRADSMQSVFPRAPHDLGVAQSWVTLRLGTAKEKHLLFDSSPAGGSGRTPVPIPENAARLIELLWGSRGLATDTNIGGGRPPDFSGYCFGAGTQQELNSRLQTARLH